LFKSVYDIDIDVDVDIDNLYIILLCDVNFGPPCILYTKKELSSSVGAEYVQQTCDFCL